jgi:SAM-dependent methyltransferase
VFFGLYTPLQGAPVIGRALAELAGVDLEVTMIGTGQDLADTRRQAAGNSRVTWRDWVPADELPAEVARHDVCLGIFGDGPKARRVVPNKVFQGAAAGCAIVTSDTPPQRSALGAAAVFVPPGDSGALAAALRRLATDRAELAALRRAAAERAATFTPEAVVRPLRDRLGTLLAAHPFAAPPGVDVMAGPDRTLPPLSPNATLRFDVVTRLLDTIRPASILEIGCGQGAAGARLARRAESYLGVEPDPGSFEIARSRIEAAGGSVLNSTHAGVPAGRQYDLVCAFEVLEHIEDDKAALSDWVGLVRPGGHLLLSVPAWPDRFGPSDVMVGHFRRYTPDQLSALTRDVGLVEPRVVLYNWPLGILLDQVKNRVGRRRTAELSTVSVGDRTAASGRLLQPGRLAGTAVAVGVTPFRYLQRLAPRRGTGLVLVGQRPA